jgi:hypothetical protein
MARKWMFVMVLLVFLAAPALAQEKEKIVPDVTGKVWDESSDREKLAFLLGACSVVAIEHHIAAKHDAQATRFVKEWVNVLRDKKLVDLRQDIDDYYAANPAKTDRLVFDVIWHDLIVPQTAK